MTAEAADALPASPALRTGRGVAVIATAMLSSAVTTAIPYTGFSLFAEEWVRAFDVSRSEIMVAMMIVTVMLGVLSPFGGRALDTLPARRLIASGIACYASGQLLLGLATAPWHVFLLYGTLLPGGMALAGVMAAQVLAVRWFPQRRGLALGTAASGMAMGGVIFPPLIAALLEQVGLRATLNILGLAGLCVLLPLALLVIRSPAEHEEAHDRRSAALHAEELTVRQILSQRAFWILTVVYLVLFGTTTGFQANMVAFAAEHRLDLRSAALLLSVMSFATIAGKFAWGYLADKAADRTLLLLVCGGCAICFFVLGHMQGVVSVSVTIGILGLAIGGMLPVVTSALSHRFGRSFGRAYGLLAFCLPLAATGAPAIAWLQERSGSYAPVMSVLALIAVAGVLPLLALRPRSA